MKKATITTVLQGCKGPQGRTRLAVLIGGVAMLLLLLSELMPSGRSLLPPAQPHRKSLRIRPSWKTGLKH